MSFGLQFTNNSNTVILDSEYARLCVICSGRYAPTQESGLGSVTNFPVTITTQEPPLIFCRPDTSSVPASFNLVQPYGVPGNWTGFYVRTISDAYAQPNGRYFAAAFQAKPLAQFGLRIWDGSSNLLFDTGTPCAVFTRALQNWTFVSSTPTGANESFDNLYTVPTSFPDNEFMLVNNFSMKMANGSTAGRIIKNIWNFAAGSMQTVVTGTANPYAFYLPALFAKMNN